MDLNVVGSPADLFGYIINPIVPCCRTMLLSGVVVVGSNNKEKESNLGSDGETSDYQRSTPSPRDGNSRIPELSTEGMTKYDLIIFELL